LYLLIDFREFSDGFLDGDNIEPGNKILHDFEMPLIYAKLHTYPVIFLGMFFNNAIYMYLIARHFNSYHVQLHTKVTPGNIIG
jgi:hypothetical protein